MSTATGIKSRSGHAPLPVQLHDGDRFTPDQVGWNWRANEAKQTLPDIVKDEAGREIVRTTLSLARKTAWPRFCCKRVGTGVFSSLQLTLPLLQRLVASTQRPEPP